MDKILTGRTALVTGSTSGSATTLSTKNFPRHFVCASQYASGVPTINRIAATHPANRTDNHNASIFACASNFLLRAGVINGRLKSEFRQQLPPLPFRHELYKILCRHFVLRRFQNYDCLLNPRIRFFRYLPFPAAA